MTMLLYMRPCSAKQPAGRATHSSLHPRRQRSSGISLSHILGPSKGSAATTAAANKARSGLVVSKQQGGYAAAAAHAGMAYRHAHLAHNGSANAIVAHVEDGIEVVHLFSGKSNLRQTWAKPVKVKRVPPQRQLERFI
jgi:hypothetical protein